LARVKNGDEGTHEVKRDFMKAVHFVAFTITVTMLVEVTVLFDRDAQN